MAKRIFCGSIFCGLFLMAAQMAVAAAVYDNGAPSLATSQLIQINGNYTTSPLVPYAAADTFTLGGTTQLNAAQLALWVPTTSTVTTLDYCIFANFTGSYSCSGAIESGTNVSLMAVNVVGTSGGFTLEDFSFALQNLTYNSGTYYLEVYGANPSSGNVYWDINGGVGCTGDLGAPSGCPSGADYSTAENPIAVQGSTTNNQSESFQMFSPEPASLITMGAGLLALAGILRRRARR